MSQNLEQKMREILGSGTLLLREPMKDHTTFRVGGPADYFAEPRDADQTAALVRLAVEAGIPWMILGKGSNLLVSDKGYRGLVIHSSNMNRIETDGNHMKVEAGARMAAIGKAAYDAGLEGFAPLSGIPGTIGGAVVMNAGAYGGEIADVLESVDILDRGGERRRLTAEQAELGYRSSLIQRNGYVVLEAELVFRRGNREAIRAQMEKYSAARKEKQPLEYPSAGSTFRRPEGYFAGKLIEEAGLRGYAVGGAQVSEKHCGFVINRGGATARDIYRLMAEIVKKVKERSGVTLEPEVKLIGEFE